jgi:hypothetical protein
MSEDEQMEESESSPLTDTESLQKIADAMYVNAQGHDERHNVFTFLNNVATASDTTKTGFLRDDKDLNEIGIPKLPIRSFLSMALISKEIMGNEYFENYFKQEAHIITDTSLSRNAKLIGLAVLQKREVADVSRRHQTTNKSWFKKKEPSTEQLEGGAI